MEDNKITCSKCGKRIPWNQAYSGFLCYECANGIKAPESPKQNSQIKNRTTEPSTSVGATILKILLAIIFVGAILFWVGACVGNFLNVDESPFPGLHWKAD